MASSSEVPRQKDKPSLAYSPDIPLPARNKRGGHCYYLMQSFDPRFQAARMETPPEHYGIDQSRNALEYDRYYLSSVCY